MISYAQNFEDVMAARLFAPEYRGFYIDIGAADPVFLSVTKHFYDSGWEGINVEPLASAHQKLVEARPRDTNLNLIVGKESGSGHFFEISDYPENSTSDEEVMKRLRKEGRSVRPHEIEMLSLRDLCDRYVGSRTIDFLKIDVEGGELSVIEGGDWTKYRPILLIIEAVEVNGRKENWQAWEPAILKAGYGKVHFDGLNNFYLREESQELSDRFRLPPNLFDGVEALRPDECAAQLADNQAYHASIIDGLTSQLQATESDSARRQAEHEAALAAVEASRAALEEHDRNLNEATKLAQGLSEQLKEARADVAWLRKERSADAGLIREQIARNSAVAHELARQHELFLKKSEAHAAELRRHLENEIELAGRIASAETSLRERQEADITERKFVAQKLESAEVDRARVAHLLETAQAECALVTQQLAEAEADRAAISERLETVQAEREHISQQRDSLIQEVATLEMTTGRLKGQLTELAQDLTAARAQHGIEASEARELQRWFEQTLIDTRAAATAAESMIKERNGELAELRGEREELNQKSEETAARAAAALAQAKLDYEMRLETAVAVNERSVQAIDIRDHWLSEGHMLLHLLRVEPEHWIVRLARNFAGPLERERQAELGERAGHWATAAGDLLASRVSSETNSNLMDQRHSEPTRPAHSLDELLSFTDRAFVKCAFVTLLGREIDPAGEAYYLSRLRRGYAKISLLKQLRRSPEGRRNDPGIAGLDRAIARHLRANLPLVGWLVRRLTGEESDGPAVRRLRAIENRIGDVQNRLSSLPPTTSVVQR